LVNDVSVMTSLRNLFKKGKNNRQARNVPVGPDVGNLSVESTLKETDIGASNSPGNQNDPVHTKTHFSSRKATKRTTKLKKSKTPSNTSTDNNNLASSTSVSSSPQGMNGETISEEISDHFQIPFNSVGCTENNESEENVDVENTEQNPEEDDNFVDISFDFEGSLKDYKDFSCLSPEDIISVQEKEIRALADLFSIGLQQASALLRHFQWKKEQLISRYLENPEQVLKEVGIVLEENPSVVRSSSAPPTEDFHSLSINMPMNVSPSSHPPSISTSSPVILSEPQTDKATLLTPHLSSSSSPNTLSSLGTPTKSESGLIFYPNHSSSSSISMCSICAEEMSLEKSTALSCRHRFCNECWEQYLKTKINEGQVTKIRCLQLECPLLVDEFTVKLLTTRESYEKYVRFLTKSFVEDSDGHVKWCPRPNCGNAINADMIRGTVVRCSCGYRFCFSCHREAHAPSSCEQVKNWEIKCKDDSETLNWKYANTKDCPKCSTAVEKNGGCNHMTCRQCKYEWCWICMRPWRGHNDYYKCNKFQQELSYPPLQSSSQKRSLLARASSRLRNRKEQLRERELERQRYRAALERYLHYYKRYVSHTHSGELEQQIRHRALTKMAELQKEATTTSAVQYILDGTEVLLECRNVLKYTYVFAYYFSAPAELANQQKQQQTSFKNNGTEDPPSVLRGNSAMEKELFEYLQEDLEKTTEQLSEVLEMQGISGISLQVHRLKALNIIQLAKTRAQNLLNAVEGVD